MRIRLSTNYRVNKMLAKIEIIIAVLDKANKVSLIMWLTKDFDNYRLL